jgi:exoribonuclease R
MALPLIVKRKKMNLSLVFFTKNKQQAEMTRTLYVGIITTYTIMKYGITRTGKPIYRCQPLDPSLPPCRIVYGGEKKGKIVLVYQYTDASTSKEDVLVELVHVIGVADRSHLLQTLFYHCGVHCKPFRNLVCVSEQEKNLSRIDCTSLELFSIDPKGCRDIDDAFSLERLSPTKTRLGVHIAQPIAFMNADMITERIQQGAFSTLYCEPMATETKPLWGREIETASSLLPGQIRPAYSTFFIVETTTGKILEKETTSFPTRVQNHHATHYEDIENSLVQHLVSLTSPHAQDTHDVVAFWMIQTNQYIGTAFPGLPCRVQSSSMTDTTRLGEELPITIQNAFSQFRREKAHYSIDPENQHHASLETERYVHFTSPIRRMMDTMIHFQITYGIPWEWEKYLDRIDELDQASHRFHRMCRLVGTVDDLLSEHKDDDSRPIEMTGYLYEKMERGRWRVYFERLGFLKIRVVSRELLHLFPEEEEEHNYPLGTALPFLVYPKKEGFLPMERLLFLPGWTGLPSC